MDNLNLAIYPGSFDPITYGHLDVLERGLKIFDSVTVLLASNAQKVTVFSVEERLDMIRTCVNDKRVFVDNLERGLVVNYAVTKRAKAIIRGLRQVSDFEYEYQISLMNRHLHSDITTVFLMPNEKYTYLASSIIKEVSRLGGDVTNFVPPYVAEKLKSHYNTG